MTWLFVVGGVIVVCVGLAALYDRRQRRRGVRTDVSRYGMERREGQDPLVSHYETANHEGQDPLI